MQSNECEPNPVEQSTPSTVAMSLFVRILDGLNDGELPHQIQVSTELRHMIEDREIGLRGRNSARVLAESQPPRRGSSMAPTR